MAKNLIKTELKCFGISSTDERFQELSTVLTFPAMPPLQPLEMKWIDHWGDLAGFFGAKRTTERCASLMTIRRIPMTVYDLSRVLQISRATLTQALDEGVNLGLIKRSRKIGDRKEYFEVAVGLEDGWDWVQWRERRRLQLMLEPSIQTCQELLKHKDDLPPEVVKRVREILSGLRAEAEFVRKEIGMSRHDLKEFFKQITASVPKRPHVKRITPSDPAPH